MKRYFMEYESDQKVCGGYNHVYGFASTLKTAKSYIQKCRKTDAQHHPRNFRIYDTLGECAPDGYVPCVYQEKN